MASKGGVVGGGGGGGGGEISSSTIREDLKISITKTLMKLREDKGVEFVEFPSTLSNIERKYVHKIASELGLKSKSYGSEEDRRIKVTKMVTEFKPMALSADPSQNRSKAPIAYRLAEHSHEKLHHCLTSCSLVQAKNSASSPSSKSQQTSKEKSASSTYSAQRSHLHKPPSARQCASALCSSYTKAQAIRIGKPEYAAMKGARSRLPSFEHAGTVNQLVKDNQIVLITGDTGCGT